MHLEEMHMMFRELAQQMGIQTTRAILPENIDICLNVAIKDTVNGLIVDNIGYIGNDKVARSNTSISSINGLRTLMKKKSIIMSNVTGEGTPNNPFTFVIDDADVMLYLNFKVIYDNKLLYDCRIIENDNLGQTIQDFCNRPTKDAPICTIVGDDTKISVDVITGINTPSKPTNIYYYCIDNPAEVYLDEDDKVNNIECDMPTYLHTDIVKKAVGIYLQSIGAVSSSNKNNN